MRDDLDKALQINIARKFTVITIIEYFVIIVIRLCISACNQNIINTDIVSTTKRSIFVCMTYNIVQWV